MKALGRVDLHGENGAFLVITSSLKNRWWCSEDDFREVVFLLANWGRGQTSFNILHVPTGRCALAGPADQRAFWKAGRKKDIHKAFQLSEALAELLGVELAEKDLSYLEHIFKEELIAPWLYDRKVGADAEASKEG